MKFLSPDRCPICDVDVEALEETLQCHLAYRCPELVDLELGRRLLIAFNYGRQHECFHSRYS